MILDLFVHEYREFESNLGNYSLYEGMNYLWAKLVLKRGHYYNFAMATKYNWHTFVATIQGKVMLEFSSSNEPKGAGNLNSSGQVIA